MPRRIEDLSGQRFGILTVISYAGKDDNNKTNWLCVCACGRKKVIRATSLKSGASASCGKCQIHGMSRTPLYRYYVNRVKKDCCDRWKDFNKYLKWAENNGYNEFRYIPEKLNKNKPYGPRNCIFKEM